MKEYKLPLKTLKLWRIRVAFVFALLIAGSSFLCLISMLFLLLVAGLAVLYGVVAYWYFPRLFKSYRIVLHENAVIVNFGFFMKMTHIMPYPRMLYAETSASPLAHMMGLSCVMLRAARGTLFIPELPSRISSAMILNVTGRLHDE